MTHMRVALLLGLLLLTWSVGAMAQTSGGEEFVNGQKGTYRGRVLEAETGRPLAGVVVVAVWRRDRVMPLGGRSEHYAARDTLTDENGDWVLEATDVERSAPKRTRRPYFTIFLPGYGRPQGIAGTPSSPPYTFYEGAGHTIVLPKLKDKRERLAHLRAIDLYGAPATEVPEFTRLVNQERVTLGLEPSSPSGTH